MVPCLTCGTATDNGPRCAEHTPTTAGRGYDAAWQRLSRLARKAQPWCSTCGATEALTTDHLRWPATTLTDVQVLCRSCNSAKGPAR